MRRLPLSDEGIITALSFLKYYPSFDVFGVLTRFFYDSNISISLEAIRSSACQGNNIAIPHLYKITESGELSQKIASIQTISIIENDSSIEPLIKYFHYFHEEDVRREIVKAINRISPFHTKVQDFNRGILMNPGIEESIKRIAVKGLIHSENFGFLLHYIPNTETSVQNEVFLNVIESSGSDVEVFIRKIKDFPKDFAADTLGFYLSAYVLKLKNVSNNYIIKCLKSSKKTLLFFLDTLLTKRKGITSIKRIFRLILLAPYMDEETESLVLDLLSGLISDTKSRSLSLLKEISSIVQVHIDNIFGKIKSKRIQFKETENKLKLLISILKNILERYATRKQIKDLKKTFNKKLNDNTREIIEILQSVIVNATNEDKKRFNACVPLLLFMSQKNHNTIYDVLNNIELEKYFLLKRLKRLIVVAGNIGSMSLNKSLWEVFDFARNENIKFLEKATVLALCSLSSKKIILQFKEIFMTSDLDIEVLQWYIEGARFLPQEVVYKPLVDIFFLSSVSKVTRNLIVDTLENFDLSKIKGVSSILFKAFEMEEVDADLKERIGDIISSYGSSSLFQGIAKIADKGDLKVRLIAIRVLKEFAKRRLNIPGDIFINRLYVYLKDREITIQIESLITLLELNDDYVLDILSDHISSEDDETICKIIGRLKLPLSTDLLNVLLKLIVSKSKRVQESLRILFSKHLKQNPSLEIRKKILKYLGNNIEKALKPEILYDQREYREDKGIIAQPKIEFRFKREHSQILTVFFIDIVGYTEKSSKTSMSGIINLVNDFENIVIPLIESYKGWVVKKMGDGILAAFRYPVNAAVSAIDIQDKIEKYNMYKMGK